MTFQPTFIRRGWFAGPTLALLLNILLGAGTGGCDEAESGNRSAATNASATASNVNSPAGGMVARESDESAFRIVVERNIFNANRSGGQVRLSSSRRPTRIESFTLVGTMSYDRGTFAFFEGSNSELTKTLKKGGVIAGHKIADVLAKGVKLEADGKVIELALGSAMRREDQGAWQLGEPVIGVSGTNVDSEPRTNRGESNGHSSYSSNTGQSSTATYSNSPMSEPYFSKQERKELKKEAKMDSATESEILKRLMERREKESK